MNIRVRFAGRLRYLRRERGWTQEALAERAELTAKYIGQLERSEVWPSLRVLDQLAGAFATPLHDLLRLPEPGVKSREMLHGQLSNDEVRDIRRALTIMLRLFQ